MKTLILLFLTLSANSYAQQPYWPTQPPPQQPTQEEIQNNEQQQQQQQLQQQAANQAKVKLQEKYRLKRRTHFILYPNVINVVTDPNTDATKQLKFSQPDVITNLGNCKQAVSSNDPPIHPVPYATFGKDRYLVKDVGCGEDLMTVVYINLTNLKYPERMMSVVLNYKTQVASVEISSSHKEADEWIPDSYDVFNNRTVPGKSQTVIKTEFFGNYPTADIISNYELKAQE